MTSFPSGFFDRADESPDAEFYAVERLVTHLDPQALAEVTRLYRELELEGDVLDLCSSWVSHFETAPEHLVAVGMNVDELDANPALSEYLIQDLNVDPILPFPDSSFDAVTCCVSVDYLTRPVEVFAEAARVLRPGAPFVVTFSNRCFPTKAIRGWLATDDRGRCTIVAIYFDQAGLFDDPTVELRNPETTGDAVYAVWARCRSDDSKQFPARPDS
jgi:SAM-dependent methyltransferase